LRRERRVCIHAQTEQGKLEILQRGTGESVRQLDSRIAVAQCIATGKGGIIQIQPRARKIITVAEPAQRAVRQSTTSQLVKLLVANLDSLALVALILEETKDRSS
jgi:hypothetical protein